MFLWHVTKFKVWKFTWPNRECHNHSFSLSAVKREIWFVCWSFNFVSTLCLCLSFWKRTMPLPQISTTESSLNFTVLVVLISRVVNKPLQSIMWLLAPVSKYTRHHLNISFGSFPYLNWAAWFHFIDSFVNSLI